MLEILNMPDFLIENEYSDLSSKSHPHDHNLMHYLIQLAYQKTPEEIEKILLEEHPTIFLKKGNQFLKNLQQLSRHHHLEKDVVESYTKILKYVLDWLKDSERKSLIIKGISNTGKTNFALALLKDHNPLLVGDKEKLKEFKKGFHKSIIFNAFDFNNISREEVIKYFDTEFDRDFRVTYGYITIPSQIKKIFTTNKEKLTKFDDLNEIKHRILNFEVKNLYFQKERPIFKLINNKIFIILKLILIIQIN